MFSVLISRQSCVIGWPKPQLGKENNKKWEKYKKWGFNREGGNFI
ncbi:MAG: hypothetical protein Q4C66_07730 [Lachnospiraceae bacterium]|nr:hypothetical protein [Lachnospiraceae bacterium]